MRIEELSEQTANFPSFSNEMNFGLCDQIDTPRKILIVGRVDTTFEKAIFSRPRAMSDSKVKPSHACVSVTS